MIEIDQDEAEKHNAKIIEDISGGKFAIIDGIVFIINPRMTKFKWDEIGNQATSV